MATCTDPVAITGGTVVSSGPYADGSKAVFQCNSGYVMSGTAYITCTAASDTWTLSPSCVLSSSNTVSVNNTSDYSKFSSERCNVEPRGEKTHQDNMSV